jgi:hypothetical protein
MHDLVKIDDKRMILQEMRKKAREPLSSSSDFEDFDGGRIRLKKHKNKKEKKKSIKEKTKYFGKDKKNDETEAVAKTDKVKEEKIKEKTAQLDNNLDQIHLKLMEASKVKAMQPIKPGSNSQILNISSYFNEHPRPYKPSYLETQTDRENRTLLELRHNMEMLNAKANDKHIKKKKLKAKIEDDIIKNCNPSLNKKPVRNFMRNKKNNFLNAQFYLKEIAEHEHVIQDLQKLVILLSSILFYMKLKRFFKINYITKLCFKYSFL